MAIWKGRPGWLGKLGLILLAAWLLVLIYSVSQMLRNNPPQPPDSLQSRDNEYAQKLSEMIRDFDVLKKQNQALTNIIIAQNSKNTNAEQLETLREKVDIELLANNRESGPSIEYEELRRKIRNDIQETWYYVNSELNKVKKYTDDFVLEKRDKEIDDAVKNIFEHKKELMIDLDRLEKFDGHKDWREQEAKDLSDLVQRRFLHLQNPSNCDKAKKLVCSLNKGCGFGCQVSEAHFFFKIIISI